MPGQAIVTINQKQWSVGVANTYAEVSTGLSGVASMPANSGVLFDLGYDQNYIQIDMSRMLFPLDIVFINSTQGVVGALQNVQPGEEAYLNNNTLPGARCFLEVNAGEAEEVGVGDSVAIQGLVPQNAGLDLSGLMNFMLLFVVVFMMMRVADRALETPKERPKLPPGYKPVYLTEIMKEPPPGYAEWKAKLEAGYGQYRPSISEAQIEQEVRSIPKDVLHCYFREKIGSQLGYLPAIRRTGVAVMPKLPEEAKGDFLFFEYIRDLVRLGETITDEEARRMWEAWKKQYPPEPRSLLQTTGKTPYDKELEQLRRDLREGAISEEAYKRAVKEILTKKHKPYRSDVTVEAWQERDRLGIWITDNRTGETIAEWWDDDAREMFEQGFFKPGVPLYSWEKPSREFVASVLDYAESVGLLARGGSPSTVPEYLPQTSTATKLDSLQVVKAFKQVSAHGEDKISVSLQAWALFPRGRRPHFISMYRSGDEYVITPLYAHISEWVHVPVTKVRAWIKSLPVRHFEPMAVAPEYREEAERLAREVDEPMAILPLPSRAKASSAVIPTEPRRRRESELKYFADSPEFLTQTIDATGYRDKLDTTFQEAIARAKGLK